MVLPARAQASAATQRAVTPAGGGQLLLGAVVLPHRSPLVAPGAGRGATPGGHIPQPQLLLRGPRGVWGRIGLWGAVLGPVGCFPSTPTPSPQSHSAMTTRHASSVSARSGGYNRAPQTGQLRNNSCRFPRFQEPGCPRSGCRRGGFPPRPHLEDGTWASCGHGSPPGGCASPDCQLRG